MGVRSKFFDPRSVKTAARTAHGDLWHRLLPWGYFLLVLALGVLAVVIYQPVIRKSQEQMNRKVWLQRQIDQQKALSMQMEDELNNLQNDPYYIERMARDILKYGRNGEVIFKFSGDLSDSENQPSKPTGAKR
ncbi:MAG: septum formation initiator family protein [Verrucomicrobiales bacterium]|jgi:cell division protein FtsB|nr:septum formation initiator family protein [Verrucomicrobiales bacterium]